MTDIFLFDSVGMEKSLSFNHELIKNLNLKKEIMLAGNIQINDQFEISSIGKTNPINIGIKHIRKHKKDC